jgi:arylsulfatase A-like enzyme
MNRRLFLSLPLVAAAQRKPPNVIILLADDLGWADVGYHESEIQTPNIDRLASQGLQLDRFYSCPLCSPTRSALMTGRWPIRYGVQYTVVRPWSRYGVSSEEHFMPETFRTAGYQTAMAGKWHMGHFARRYFPGSRGFDSSYGHFNGAIDYYTHQRESGLDWHRNGKTLDEQGYSTELIGAEAERRIRERDKTRPLFLYVPFNAPHTPLQAPKALIDRYASIGDEKRRTFAAMVTAMDAQVGRVLDALDQERIAGETIVLFFSDNGGPVGAGARNSPLRGQKGTTFEGGTRVPAVLRWPGRLKAGKTSQVMTVHDVFPTLAAAAGTKPAGRLPLDGRNLWSELSAGRATPREDLFFAVDQAGRTYFALHSGPWKLVRQVETKTGSAQNLLFRIHDDPNESSDLAAQNPEVVRDLVARLDQWKSLHPPQGLRHSDAPPGDWKGPRRWADEAEP